MSLVAVDRAACASGKWRLCLCCRACKFPGASYPVGGGCAKLPLRVCDTSALVATAFSTEQERAPVHPVPTVSAVGYLRRFRLCCRMEDKWPLHSSPSRCTPVAHLLGRGGMTEQI